MNGKEKIDILIDKLQQHQPQLQNSNELSDHIMETIKAVQHKKAPRFLSYIQTFSGVASILLTILFVFQSNQYERKNTKTTSAQPITIVSIAPDCMENLNKEEYDLMEMYLCYLQHNSERNKQSKNLRKLLSL